MENISIEDIGDIIFKIGFSTKIEIDEYSGRGVGLDCVYKDLAHIKGSIHMRSLTDINEKGFLPIYFEIDLPQGTFTQ